VGSGPVERKLAAILVADIAGFSLLAGEDEERTLARMRALLSDLVEPALSRHAGRVVKGTGDGFIAEFRSAVDAARCAIEVQDSMANRNRDLPPERRMDFRIGIHVGDVVQESDGDLMGNGVNIAARLQTISRSGGIVISEDTLHQVEGRVEASFIDIGDQRLKNIARPVRVYRMEYPTQNAPHTSEVRIPVARLSLVVLPFVNLSQDPAEDYLADGITQDVTADLSRIPGSFVISSATALSFKGKSPDPKQVGRELGVRYALQASVRKSGNRVRANAQLIDAVDGALVFADHFDCDRADLIDLQDEITARIAGAIGTGLIDAEGRRSLKERPTNPDAVDLTMRGWAALHRPPTRTSLAEARQLFEQALVLDDHSADALVGLAYARARAASSGFTASMDAELDGALATILRALELAPERATAHWVHGIILRRPKQFAEAAAAFEKAIQLDRNFAAAYGSLADTKTWLGQLKETVELVERAIRLSPHDPLLANWQFYAGTACWYAGDLAGVYALRDQMDLARAELARAQRGMAWVTSVEKLKDYMPTTEPKMLERDEKWYELLRLIGLPDR